LVSIHPRQMRQADRADMNARRRYVAAAAGKGSLRDVAPEDVPVWDSNGEVIERKHGVSGKKLPPPPPRPKRVREKYDPEKPHRQYAKREIAGSESESVSV
jgi:hypothetical protein